MLTTCPTFGIIDDAKYRDSLFLFVDEGGNINTNTKIIAAPLSAPARSSCLLNMRQSDCAVFSQGENRLLTGTTTVIAITGINCSSRRLMAVPVSA